MIVLEGSSKFFHVETDIFAKRHTHDSTMWMPGDDWWGQRAEFSNFLVGPCWFVGAKTVVTTLRLQSAVTLTGCVVRGHGVGAPWSTCRSIADWLWSHLHCYGNTSQESGTTSRNKILWTATAWLLDLFGLSSWCQRSSRSSIQVSTSDFWGFQGFR